MSEPKAHLGVLFADIHFPSSGSLKSKRRILKSLKDKIRSRYNVSIAEIDHLDKWQRIVLGISVIGTDKKYLNGYLESILSFMETLRDMDIANRWMEFL
jgi:hypothetical protein